jgi:hypothetical protein
MATIFDTIVSELSRWGRHELPASPTPRLPEKPIDPLWDGTDFALLLGDIEHRCSSWSVDALLDAAESELEEGKAAHLRRAPVIF